MATDAIRGRGAALNPPNRFLSTWHERDPDLEEPPPPAPATEYLRDFTKNIIATNNSPDVGFDVSVNPYRGCEHGCAYCFARPTHEYLGFSAGLDFETKIVVKHEAPALLRAALMKKSWKPQVLGMSGVTDCYQPIERELQLTRGCLAVLAEFRNPVAIITKNALVARDVDLLADLAQDRAAVVLCSITSLDPELIGVLEPRTSRPRARLAAIRTLSAAGVPVGVLMGPLIPGLTDHELPQILEAAAEAGAKFASWIPIRLPWAVAPMFEAWLDEHRPDRKERVLNHIRAMRGGRLNEPNFGARMQGQGEHLATIRQMFELTCRKLGLNREPLQLSAAAFRQPFAQLKLF